MATRTVKQSELKVDQRRAIREEEKGEKFLLLLVGKAGEILQWAVFVELTLHLEEFWLVMLTQEVELATYGIINETNFKSL